MAKELYLIHGKPGSGKTTASKMAAEKLGDAYHFSIGAELRARALDNKPSQYSKELKPYAEKLRQSLPIPPEIVALVFQECVASSPYETIIADGYPQYPDRLPAFEATLKSVMTEVLAICLIDVSDDVAKQRMRGREQRTAGIIEDETYISKRLESYEANLIPTIEALSHDYPVTVINGMQAPEAVADDLVRVIEMSKVAE